MQFTPNQRFQDFLVFLKQKISEQALPPSAETSEYRAFITKFPASQLAQISLDEYCVGKGGSNNFCWWLERGLQKILGRYVPGTSTGHILYFAKDGTLAKKKKLQTLSDEEALRYTMTIQAAIANANLADATWIDDDKEIYRRTGLPALGTMAEGRKLRLLTAYHPNELLPLSSSAHVGHFLLEFGCPQEKIPKFKQAIARLLLLNELFYEAKKHIPQLSPNAMMWAMYDEKFGISPLIDETEDDADGLHETAMSLDQTVPIIEEIEEQVELNQILAGPPGTGKTYATVEEAIKIIEPDFFNDYKGDRAALKERFDELVADGQIRFTTFHQSFSYEDFIEGLRAETDDASGQISYEIEPGIFQQICAAASKQRITIAELAVNDNPRIWKISINGSADNPTRRYCFNHGEARIGWGETGDLRHADLELPTYNLGSNDKSSLRNFSQDIQVGDILLCLASNTTIGAVGVVRSEYIFDTSPPTEVERNYNHMLKVNWLLRDIRFSILEHNANKTLALKTVYEMRRINWPDLSQSLQKAGFSLHASKQEVKTEPEKPFVLIIDEINRGNVSRIFGELITLIESSKRAGMPEALEVRLPYSKKAFKVPRNVYLIGTMNTADRSLTGLDIALRRRFQFKEMLAEPAKLAQREIAGIALAPMLAAINKRIEILLGRDYCIGHAYFIHLKSGSELTKLAQVFRNKIMPLLQEYFFEDWQRIAWVLNDQNKDASEAFVRQEVSDISSIFGGSRDIVTQNPPWQINQAAFENANSYLRIYERQP